MKILLLYPQWLPCNHVGIMRMRLLAGGLADNGCEVHLVTPQRKYCPPEFYYDDLLALKDERIRIHECAALPRWKCLPRGIVYRAFLFMIAKGIRVVRKEKIDFVLGSALPGETLLIARFIHTFSGVPYGVDYQDPWRKSPIPCRRWTKHYFAALIPYLLEGFAIRKAAFFTGVSELSYLNAMNYWHIRKDKVFCQPLPMGFDRRDYAHESDYQVPWGPGEKPWVFAGGIPTTFYPFWRGLFSVIADLRREKLWPENSHFYFWGVGGDHPMTNLAAEYGVGDLIREDKNRISYLKILHIIKQAAVLPAIGMPEPYFTASKIFQLLLTEKPIFAIYHKESSVNAILKENHADTFLVPYDPALSEESFKTAIREKLLHWIRNTAPWQPDLRAIDNFSIASLCREFICNLEKI